MSALAKTSIARKLVMALSGLFLVIFLTQHFVINITSVIAPDLFNSWSHFMGTNFLVQALLQPVLIIGLIVHFVMGIVLEIQNNKARPIKYASYKGSASASWMSRNMIITGLVILAFLGLHFYDFWVPEMVHKYVESHPEDPTRYYPETVEKFADLWRVILYVISFVLLMLHLLHGFKSSFQTIGANLKHANTINTIIKIWAVVIPLGFIFIAVYHFLNPITH